MIKIKLHKVQGEFIPFNYVGDKKLLFTTHSFQRFKNNSQYEITPQMINI